LRAGDRVVVALSGGADSVALLLALSEANQASSHTYGSAGRDTERLGIVLSAAHVHHGLRGEEADEDEAFVRDLCTRQGIPLRVIRVDTAARQAAEGEGVEEAARELRYAALRGLLAEGAADVIATAHTLDDQAETVLMKMLRGAWTEGLGGISPVVEESGKPGRVIRPLLAVRRAQIEAFLQSRSQAWREDSSNRDLTLTRNRVRHELMPALKEFNPQVDTLLARTSEIAREEEAFWRAEVERLLPQLVLPGKPVRGGGRAVSTAAGDTACGVEVARLATLPPALRRRLVRAMESKQRDTTCIAAAMSSDETAKVLALAGFGGSASVAVTGRIGSRLELHGGLRVERSARELRFSCQK
jgi:tRNA(Ile)-lysidine synthase